MSTKKGGTRNLPVMAAPDKCGGSQARRALAIRSCNYHTPLKLPSHPPVAIVVLVRNPGIP